MRRLLNVVEPVQLFTELEEAEGGLSLRHCLHLNLNSYIKLCKFQKLVHKFSKQQVIFAL